LLPISSNAAVSKLCQVILEVTYKLLAGRWGTHPILLE
jgi:hypothetical protein